MIPRSLAKALSFLAVVLLVVQPCFGFQSRLSDESVREAYFLGQRHDSSFSRLLEEHIKRLPQPKSGPYIAYVAFYTPFVQLVQYSNQFIGNYSAQQALSQRNQVEKVKVEIQIHLTKSYPGFLLDPLGKRVGPSAMLIPRPSDFWKDFHVQVFDGRQILPPSDFRGHADYSCGRWGQCALTGATLELEFPPDAFTSDSATIEVSPPEGDPVSVKFDVFSLR